MIIRPKLDIIIFSLGHYYCIGKCRIKRYKSITESITESITKSITKKYHKKYHKIIFIYQELILDI